MTVLAPLWSPRCGRGTGLATLVSLLQATVPPLRRGDGAMQHMPPPRVCFMQHQSRFAHTP